jgi:hypothetical protein
MFIVHICSDIKHWLFLNHNDCDSPGELMIWTFTFDVMNSQLLLYCHLDCACNLEGLNISLASWKSQSLHLLHN